MDKARKRFQHIIAIDPGTEKCGLAVVGVDGKICLQEIVPVSQLKDTVKGVARQYGPALLVVGDRTGAESFMDMLKEADMAGLGSGIESVDEHLTSQEARKRYLVERQRKGSWLYRMIPLGMQSPDQPYDDYVAVILAERYLDQHQ